MRVKTSRPDDAMQAYLSKVIWFGGVPMRRGEVMNYLLAEARKVDPANAIKLRDLAMIGLDQAASKHGYPPAGLRPISVPELRRLNEEMMGKQSPSADQEEVWVVHFTIAGKEEQTPPMTRRNAEMNVSLLRLQGGKDFSIRRKDEPAPPPASKHTMQEFKEAVAKYVMQHSYSSRKDIIQEMKKSADFKAEWGVTDAQIEEVVMNTLYPGEYRKGDVVYSHARFKAGSYYARAGTEYPYYKTREVETRHGDLWGKSTQVEYIADDNLAGKIVLKNVPKRYAEEWILHKLDPKQKAPGKLGAVERLEFWRTSKPIYHPTDTVIDFGKPAKGFDVKELESRPGLLYGGAREGVLTDGFLLIPNRQIAEKILGGHIAKMREKEIQSNMSLNSKLTRAEAEALADKSFADRKNSSTFPDWKQLVPEDHLTDWRMMGVSRSEDQQKNLIWLSAVDNKAGKIRYIAINADMLAFIKKQLGDHKVFTKEINSGSYSGIGGKGDDSSPHSSVLVLRGYNGEVNALVMPMFVREIPKVIQEGSEKFWESRGKWRPGIEPEPEKEREPDKEPGRHPGGVMPPGVSTGNFSPTYIRPIYKSLSESEQKTIKEGIETGKMKLLENGMYVLGNKTPNGFADDMMVTFVVWKQKDGTYKLAGIPTDKKGKIPDITKVERIMDVADGDRGGGYRNVTIDVMVDAETIYPDSNLGGSYEWFMHPNETDISQIDTHDTKIVEILEGGKDKEGQKPTRGRLIIMGGSDREREWIAKNLDKNFTKKELSYIKQCLIVIQSGRGRWAGMFSGSSDANGKPLGVPKIFIDPEHVSETGTLIHEAIHALREFDRTRLPKLAAVKEYRNRGADLEEALTEAETVARQNPFGKHLENAGYYHQMYLKDKNGDKKSNAQMILEDRVTETGTQEAKATAKENWGKILTESSTWKETGKRGKRAQRLVVHTFPETNIAHLNMHGGRVEAIDTYYELDKNEEFLKPSGERFKNLHPVKAEIPEQHIQLYEPNATEALDKKIDREIVADNPGRRITQWEDMKATLISGKRRRGKMPHSRMPKLHNPRVKPRAAAKGAGIRNRRIKQYYTAGRNMVSRKPIGKKRRG